MERYICIHGHFYQPPREDAWLGRVERQDSAYPYHDWNERVTAECYLPNTASRLLDGGGYIRRVVNNYARMSFDFGPALLAWMHSSFPDVYQAVIAADRESRAYFSGHGSALACVYNHIILPLANHRDRYTQAFWGIRDFEHRFGRPPEGMWLPEMAVDLEALDILAGLGIKYTVLAPHQAGRVRPIGAADWQDAGGGIDITRAYLVNLPSGRPFSVFFYDKPIASAVSFQDTLKNGDTFVGMLTGAFSDRASHPQLVHIATDGENYGHHHRFGDMALAYTLDFIETNQLAKLTNYGEFLKKFPPALEAEIIKKTSWSCAHGVDRWWRDCGDKTGAGDHPGWNQQWRTPLRNAFDWLRDSLSPRFEVQGRGYFKDPWAARDDYIGVILDPSPDNVGRFLTKHAGRQLNNAESASALKLLEMQRYAMMMYTSDGWFFDELSRPEPIQVMQYAGRAIQLARELFGDSLEEGFLKILEQARSNIPAQGDGRRIFEHLVRPAMLRAESGAGYDDRYKTLGSFLESALADIETPFRSLFEKMYPPERFSAELGGPVPPAFLAAEKLIINNALRRAVRSVPVDVDRVRDLLGAAVKWQVKLDTDGIAYDLKLTLEKMMNAFAAAPGDAEKCTHLLAAVSLARALPFPVDLWKVQHFFWGIVAVYQRFRQREEWARAFVALGEQLHIRVG
jgi:alpha-amylase/alpha-mannosidase (GH57 family)